MSNPSSLHNKSTPPPPPSPLQFMKGEEGAAVMVPFIWTRGNKKRPVTHPITDPLHHSLTSAACTTRTTTPPPCNEKEKCMKGGGGGKGVDWVGGVGGL